MSKEDNNTFSIRVDKKDIERFNDLVKKAEIGKGLYFRTLLDIAEMQDIESKLNIRKGEIEAFNYSIDQITTIYKNSLRMALTAKDQAEDAVNREMEASRKISVGLQERIESLEKEKGELENTIKVLNEEIKRLQNLVKDKDTLVSSLEGKLRDRNEVKTIYESLMSLIKEKGVKGE